MKKALFLFLVLPLLLGAKYSPEKRLDLQTRAVLDAFATTFAKKHQLQFLNSGTGLLVDSDKAIWVLSLTSPAQLTLEEGRAFVKTLTTAFFQMVSADPRFAEYCKHSFKKPVFNEECIGFRLAFWDANTNRPLPPFLAEIKLIEGNFYYFYADPLTQALQAPLIEPLALND